MHTSIYNIYILDSISKPIIIPMITNSRITEPIMAPTIAPIINILLEDCWPAILLLLWTHHVNIMLPVVVVGVGVVCLVYVTYTLVVGVPKKWISYGQVDNL